MGGTLEVFLGGLMPDLKLERSFLRHGESKAEHGESNIQRNLDWVVRLARRVVPGATPRVALIVGRDESPHPQHADDGGTAISSALITPVLRADDAVTSTDIRSDPRWADLSVPHGVTALAAHPIRSGGGQVIGTFCLTRDHPHAFAAGDLEALADFALAAEAEIRACISRAVESDLIGQVQSEQRAALTDPLTRIANREAIFQSLERALGRRDESIGLMMIDVDHFKQINDTLGHSAGDQVLREVAHRLHLAATPAAQVGRFGGEEFLAVAADVEAAEGLIGQGERLRNAIAGAPVTCDGGPLRVTVSIGLSFRGGVSARDAAAMIREADQALYRAKRLGRNRVEMHHVNETCDVTITSPVPANRPAVRTCPGA